LVIVVQRAGPRVGRLACTVLLLTLTAGLSVTVSTALAVQPSPRVVGGTVAPASSWRSIAGLELSQNGSTYCGGTLVAPRWVLTAGHCPTPAYVGLGRHDLTTTDGEQIAVSGAVLHPSFETVNATPRYDFQLLHLATASAQPVLRLAAQTPPVGAVVRIAGWGRTTTAPGTPTSTVLMEAPLQVVSDASCATVWTSQYFAADSMLCAAYDPAGPARDACNGDSGGPLTYTPAGGTEVLAGLTSWGTAQCASPGVPGVYARVAAARTWITQQIGPVAALSVTSLALGSQPVGTTSATKSLQVQNTGTTTLTISSATAGGDFHVAQNGCTTVAPGASCAVAVTVTPTAAGPRSGILTVTGNGYDATVTAALSATGMPVPDPATAATPVPADAPVPVGDPAPPASPTPPAAAPVVPVSAAGVLSAPRLTFPLTGERIATVRRSGALTASCTLSAAGRCRLTATISAAQARRLGLAVARGHTAVTIGSGSATVRRAGTVTVTLRLTAAAKRALGRVRGSVTVRLAAVATGGDGRSTTASKTALLRR
jgi:secreted trypsin-like serine protease